MVKTKKGCTKMARKGENIYKRKDGRWEGRYIKSRDVQNKAIYGYVYAQSYGVLKQKLNEAKINPIDEKIPTKSCHTFSKWIDLWLQKKELSVKESTYIRYRNIIERHIKPSLGNLNIRLINTSTLQRFVAEQLSNGKVDNSGGLSEKTVTDIIMILKNILNYSKVNGEKINCDFTQIVIKKKFREMRVLSIDEERRLNKVLFDDTDKYKLGILICLYTGIRIGELCALQWKNISFTDKTLKVERTMQRLQFKNREKNKTKIIITEPKSVSSYRIIPIPDFLLNVLKIHKGHSEAFVLAHDNKKYIEPRTMQNHFKKYIKEANITDANFHCLRHTFATRCIEADFEIKSLSEILGHSSVKITLDKYVHVTMQMKRDNMSKVKLAV